jgi:Outer membrane protein beta-barrel domain
MNKSRKFAALLIITIISSAFPGVLLAQDAEDDEPHGLYLEEKKVFYGGLVAGGNFAQVDGDWFAGYRKIGVNAGAIVYAQLAKHIALSLEILYSQKGSQSKSGQYSPKDPSIYLVKYGINLNYAEIPLMINYFDKRKSHFGIGVSYGRLVSSKETVNVILDTLRNVVTSMDFNSQYPFKKDAFDFLAGVELHLWKGLFLNIRFQYSLIPIRTQNPPPSYARSDQSNNLWAVRVMYLLK